MRKDQMLMSQNHYAFVLCSLYKVLFKGLNYCTTDGGFLSMSSLCTIIYLCFIFSIFH